MSAGGWQDDRLEEAFDLITAVKRDHPSDRHVKAACNQRKEQDALFEKHRDCWNKPKCLHGDDKECPYQGIPF